MTAEQKKAIAHLGRLDQAIALGKVDLRARFYARAVADGRRASDLRVSSDELCDTFGLWEIPFDHAAWRAFAWQLYGMWCQVRRDYKRTSQGKTK